MRRPDLSSLMPRNLSLLAKFGVLSLISILVLGVVLGRSLGDVIEKRSLAGAREKAALASDLSFRRLLTRKALKDGLSRKQVKGVEAALRPTLAKKDVERAVVWNRDLRVVYSDRTRLIGRKARAPEGARAALKGVASSEVISEDDARATGLDGETLAVQVPLRLGSSRTPAGAVELFLPYGPIAAGIASDTWKLYGILFAGLFVLWGALARIVSGASRQLHRQAGQNEHQANHDALTGLPNRALFRDLVRRATTGRRRKGSLAAVMIMDLDRFKEINDTLGHYNGDLLLQRVGPRIRGALRDQDTVARLGGDEYAVLLPDMPDAAAVTHAAQRILAELREPVAVGGLALEVEASIGIALFPDHADRVDTLLQRADVAMYTAKEAHSGYVMYSEEQHDYSPARLALVGELRRAIDKHELVLHYQPKADLETGRVIGMEALARWEHPRRGMLPPDEFISLAEHTSLISPLTLYLLETAIVQCRAWEKQGHDLSVAVNLSVRNLLDRQLAEDVRGLLDKHSLAPSRLELEITESMIMSEPRRALKVLTDLHDMGIKLSIDDFGTGYSSLSYLKRLPVSAIKIDRSFVMNMVEDPNDAMIVESTVSLGRSLGLGVVAEGVETAEAWRRLADMGCNIAQGYYLSKPLPAPEIVEWMLARPAAGQVVEELAEVSHLRSVDARSA